MIIKEDLLLTTNSKNKIRLVILKLDKETTSETYTISRITKQFGGKDVNHPMLRITSGKATRNALQQATLEYNSLYRSYLDKGYVKNPNVTSKTIGALSESDLIQLIGRDVVSDQSGVPKPMLAKLADKCSADIWDRFWAISKKLDGIRCLVYYKDGEIHTASRGGKSYDPSTLHIRTNPELLKIFSEKPDLILDGELYHHGADWPLQRISGLARLQEWTEECNELEYWIFDYVDTCSFRERLKFLQNLSTKLTSNTIRVLEHKIMSGYLSIKAEHDKYVNEGFEGLCARNLDKEYGVNTRSSLYLIKMKDRKDAEFLITGIKEGLRPEDMCFTLVTKSGKEFAAKPVGNSQSRTYFLEHYKEFIGKKATCTYFNLSKDGIPTQPVLKSIRPNDE